ncbi:MAG: hypothetical protein GEV28_19890 [Actinophytocola sp.]|uniref:hypothetical protein n=1 Tax=Actinophytocola sp. TaxID=1872138 RepID=UPI001326FED0|nr:hypothetical protein [Actinophytocola sp.]MPZ82536.1 hypothetical protein [Actinophytocola sp.]
MYYDTAGHAYLVTASPDAPFVVSAYLEYDSCAGWYFGYTRREQQAIADLVSTTTSLGRAILFVWFDAVDPYLEGRHPAVSLDLIITGDTGWARFTTDERADGAPVTLLTVDEHNLSPSRVRLGREIYTDRPFLPADRIRGAGAEYVSTGHLPESVSWQRRAMMVPQGPFGKRLVAEEDLPPKLDWSYPKQAQPWAYDPPPLPMAEDRAGHTHARPRH